MAALNYLMQLPHVYVWLPALVFLAVLAIFYFFTPRPAAVECAEPTVTTEPAKSPVEAAAPKSKDQRGATRRQGNTIEVHVAPPEDKSDPALGSVIDRSLGGMRLALFHEVEIGAVLALHPVLADEMVPWVDIEVRSCKPSTEMPGMFEVGCQYVKSPPYSIQLLFG
ncbi:MAG: hypothetical protein FJ303_15095 [Planctomycetes bacterium]|nr:hypothetical protein [Planctomycetota bacterium]